MSGELFSLFARLTLDSSEYESGLDNARSQAGVFGDVLKADLVGRGISAAIDGFKQLAGAVVDFGKQAVSGYGQVEQLRGGIETLFGESATQVLEDADKAFQTAGMSAAQYMDTSIQSAAAMINSLGGDQKKAAELMNLSITDMSDNVNKMGTSMEGVQNAYRGFSRGNFTMLDNLALGFAGTKEGMQELLDKATELSGVEYDISSYSDIVQAIHVVQTEMGVTGTTAKEAAGTIEGSIGAMKAAWENLVNGIADPEADIGTLMTNVLDTAGTALENIIPAAERAVKGMGEAVMKAAPAIAEKIPEIVEQIAPSISEAVMSLAEKATDFLTDAAPQFFDFAVGVLDTILTGISEGLPDFLSNILPMLETLSEGLREGAGSLIDVGIKFLENIMQGLMDSLPTLIETLPQIIINIAGIINDNAPKLIVCGIKLIGMIVTGLIEAIPTLVANIPKIFEAILAVWSAINWVSLGKSVITFITNGIKSLTTTVPQALKDIGQKAIEFFRGINWSTAGTQAVTFIKNAITGLASMIPNALKAIGQTAMNAFKSINWLDLGANIIRGIVNGISSGVGWIVDAAREAARAALNAAKSFLGIHSPSRVARDQIGQMYSKGLALGIEDKAPDVENAVDKIAGKLEIPVEPSMDFGTAMTAGASGAEDMRDTLIEVLSTIFGQNDNGRDLTIVMELDQQEFARAVYRMNAEETQRVGVKLAGGGV